MRAIKLGIIFMYIGAGVFLLSVALLVEDTVDEVICYILGTIMIMIGILILRTPAKKISGFVPWIVVITLLIAPFTWSLFIDYITGDYRAVICYEKSHGVYVLKGVEIYAKSFIIPPGQYYLELSSDDYIYKCSGILRFNSSIVVWMEPKNKDSSYLGSQTTHRVYAWLERDYDEYSVYYELHIRPEDVITLRLNGESTKYIDFRNCLLAGKPLDFDMKLVHVGCGWITIPIDKIKIVIS